jgi:hypothetical protein
MFVYNLGLVGLLLDLGWGTGEGSMERWVV